MTNWRSGSLLLACALGLGTAGCGDDENPVTDAGMDSAVTDSAVMDAMMDTSVPPDTSPRIRLAMLPAGFEPIDGNPLTPQAFNVCLSSTGSTENQVMASVTSFTPPISERALPVGAISQHYFSSAQLGMVCGFPANPNCTARIYRDADVTLSVSLNTPFCTVVGNAEPVASVVLTPTTFTGADAFTVAFIGDAASLEADAGAVTPLSINVFPDEIAATDATKARVRIVNFDPAPFPTAPPSWEVCTAPFMAPEAQTTLLGNAASSAAQLNPSGSRSAYVNIDPLAPSTVPDGDGGTATLPLVFTAHIPDPLGLTHCNPLPDLAMTDGATVTMWPSTNTPFAPAFTQYSAGVAMGGAMPIEAFAAGEVSTIYLMRVFSNQPEPVPPTIVVAIAVRDRPLVP